MAARGDKGEHEAIKARLAHRPQPGICIGASSGSLSRIFRVSVDRCQSQRHDRRRLAVTEAEAALDEPPLSSDINYARSLLGARRMTCCFRRAEMAALI